MVLAAGAHAVGADFQNLEVKQHAPLDSGTLTSTTYTTTRSGATSPVGVAFTAPPSGKVKVHWACGVQNSGSGGTNYTLMAFQVKTGTTIGSGTTIQSASDSLCIENVGVNEMDAGRTSMVVLTPGLSYNVSGMYRVGAGTGTVSRVEMIVDPCIA
jgi:hypothetical protein